jgi:long-subunit acyl-CoA synthetase (AMP-forming)
MIEYSSPIDGLFAQVQSVRPTSMACPPNIWAGLHQKYVAELAKASSAGYEAERAARAVVSAFDLSAVHTIQVERVSECATCCKRCRR